MSKYQFAIVVTVEADSFEAAHEFVSKCDVTCENMLTSELPYYEQDNEGQRVLYLHPECESVG